MAEIDAHKLAAKLKSLMNGGRFPSAVRGEANQLYEQLRISKRNNTDLVLALAVLYRKSRLFMEADAVCNQVLELQPHNALAHHISGSIQQCLGNHSAAIIRYRTAISLDATLAETRYFLGNILQMNGRSQEAVENYRKAVILQPDYLEALSNLGAVLMALHRFEEARKVLETANSFHPDCPQVLCNLGDLALRDGDYEKARSYAASVLGKNPQFFDAHHLSGKVCRQQEDYEKTLKHFSRALEIRPNDENLIGSIAEILEKRSEFSAARQLLQPLLQRGTHNPLVLKAWSALSRSLGKEQEAVHLLESAVARDGLHIHESASLHSELGKQYDHLGDYGRAFEHYRQANLLERELKTQGRMKSGTAFTTIAEINKWFEQFDAAFWKTLPCAGSNSKRPVFVVGMPRSGTTLAEQILASHPDVYGAGELQDIPDLAAHLGEHGTGVGRIRYLASLNRQNITAAAENYLGTLLKRSPDALRVVDKMPTNFAYIGLISLLFPNAYIIHMQRDPRDTCLSMYFQRFGASMLFTTDLQELAAYYSAYTRMMEYWKSVLDTKILDIQYEELVSDQEHVIRRMIKYCELDWNERCLNFHTSSRDIHTPSYDQVRKPMYRKSAGRWKHYEKQLAPLIKALNLTP